MATNRSAEPAEQTKNSHDKIFMENTLLRIAGALFCHDAKRAPTRTEEIVLNKGITEKNIVIRPDPRLGQPGPLAHKMFVALLKKHSDYGKPIRKEISFTRREIGRLIGRKEWGGRDSEQLVRALHEIHHTFITTHFKKPGGRYQEHSFNIFPEILIERREFASDPIEACTITVAEPIISSLQDEHFTCLNFPLMQQLGTIGQALYMRLFFHFANLYNGTNRSRLFFQKRYEDICVEWLGGLSVVRHKSKISDRLGPHLDQLVAAGFLASYQITSAKADDCSGFVLGFRPAQGFFDDYERFYRRRQQGELQWDFHADQREIGEPLRVAGLFAQLKNGKAAAQPYVSSKEVENARQLLADIPFSEMQSFLEFALSEARKTDFDVQTLGGVRQYVERYRATCEARAAAAVREAAEQERAAEEEERAAYDSYRRAQAKVIFAGLSREEQTAIEAAAGLKARSFNGSLGQAMRTRAIYALTLERHGDRIKSFENWRSQH